MSSRTIALAEISSFITKGATPTTYGYQWESTGVPFLRSECVGADGLDMTQSMFISSHADHALRRSRVAEGDLLMTITGNVGRVIRLSGVLKANINQHIARIRVTSPLFEPEYVFHYLGQSQVREHFESITTGQAYPQLSLAQVRAAAIPIRPLSEQKSIALALGAAGDQVANLKNLIAKKRDVKQGMMQELLTGRTRLPGFVGEWGECALGGLIDGLVAGTSVRSVDGTARPAVLKTSAVRGGRLDELEVKAILPEDIPRARCMPVADSIIVSRMNTPALVGEVGYVERALPAVYLPDRLWLARARQGAGTNMRWLAALLSFGATAETVRGLATGTSNSMKNIAKDRLLALRVPSPPSREQHAIGSLLADADAEIAVLECRLESAREVKIGMMQELLTGRTRLPVMEEA